MKKGEFGRWNERMFAKYGNVRLYRHPNPVIRYTENKRVRILLDSVKGAGKVVDVGCGEGYILRQIDSGEVVGVDISDAALKEARASTKATLVKAAAESIPYPDHYFDAAICSEVLEHTEKPALVVKELARIVRPGGIIVLSVPNEHLINRIKDIVWSLGLFSILFPDVPRRQDDEWHLHKFDLGMLKHVAAGYLEIKKIRAVPFGFLPIRYIAICANSSESP